MKQDLLRLQIPVEICRSCFLTEYVIIQLRSVLNVNAMPLKKGEYESKRVFASLIISSFQLFPCLQITLSDINWAIFLEI